MKISLQSQGHRLGMQRSWKAAAVTLVMSGIAVGSSAQQESGSSSAGSEQTAEEVFTLPEFTVATQKDAGYNATESNSGTRLAAQIVNLPYSMQVMTEEFIQDFKLLDLDDQALFIGGMAPGDKNAGGGGATRLRGFLVPYFRNGFYRRQAPDSNSIARVEVIKGPQSAIYGRVAPGGVVNYISKKPLTVFQSGLSYSLGTYDYQQVTGFATGPLVKGKLYYRVDATYYDMERPTDFWYNRTRNVSGSLVYKLNRETSVTFEYEHTLRTMNGVSAITRYIDSYGVTGGSVWDLPNRAVAERLVAYNTNGARQKIDRGNDSFYLTLEHRFSAGLSLRANLGYSTREFERHGTSTLTTWDTRVSRYTSTFNNLDWVDETQGMWTGDRAGAHQTVDDLQYGSQIDLTKTWDTAVKQRTLLTFDAFEDETKQKTWSLSGSALNAELAALGYTTVQQQTAWKRPDPFNPDVSGYLALPAFKSTWSMTDSSTYNLFRTYYGGLLSHSVELLNERLMLTGSVRQDWAKFNREQPLSSDPELKAAKSDAKRLTYSTGLNYHFIPKALVGYISYGSSFNPNPQTDPNTGTLLGNTTAKGFDTGIKGVLMEEALSYTVGAYWIEQDNEVTDNPDNPGGTDLSLPRYVPGGGTRGNGLAVDVSGRLTKNLSLQGNIAWTFVEIYKNDANPALIGTKPLSGNNPPARTAGVGASYSFGPGRLKGLRVGASYQYATRYLRTAATATSTNLYVAGISQVGAFARYSFPKWRKIQSDLAINVSNLFKERELTTSFYAPPGREFKFTLNLKF